MSFNNNENDIFTYRKKDDFVVIYLQKGAKRILTSIEEKENLISLLKTINESGEFKGVAIVYSENYPGNTEYRKFLLECIEGNKYDDKSRYTTPYKAALFQFLDIVRRFPLPIVGGMIGEIGPDSLGLSLSLDLRIAAESALFLNPNLEIGFPPSALLSYYMLRGLGPARTTELMLTRNKFNAQEALEIGLITEIVSDVAVENTCLEKLRHLCAIPAQALVESRRLLQPGMKEIRNGIEAGFDSAIRSLYSMKT
jgi:1,4-dihydroxy-2-naphthoyl-CoA synthase